MKTRKRLGKDTTMDDKGQTNLKGVTKDEISIKKKGFNVKIVNSHMRMYDDSKRRIWWIGWRQWFRSKWRDKVDIAGQTKDEGEITSTGHFGTYQRMCGFGGGECRSVFRTLRENVNIIYPI